MTDNRNRTVSEVRHAFSKCGGNLGTDGSVAYLFTRRGQLTFSADADEESLMEAALESGAEDFVTNDDGSFDVFTSFEEFGAVRDALEAAGFAPESAEVTMVPSTQAELDLDTAQKVVRLIDMLEDLDDVQNVYSNASISDDIMEQLG
jgi:YebC/PmpR family DNA-binding regulatory protein